MQLRKPTLIVLGAGVGFVKSFVKGRIQVTEKPRKGKKTESTGENIYGGFRYRFSYDDYMRELGQKLQRRQGMGRKAFVVTALVLTGMCAAVLFTAVGYAGQQKQSGRTDSVGIQSALNRTYDTEDLGDMIVESVCPSMTSLYRIPCGVMVTLVNDTASAESHLEAGDIILQADGQETPDVASLKSVFTHRQSGERILLSVYREGESIEIDYVIDQ